MEPSEQLFILKSSASSRYPYDEAAREQRAVHVTELRNLSDLAFVFLNATNGNSEQAAELFEQSIDLLCEGAVLQMYRYRTVLAAIREGL